MSEQEMSSLLTDGLPETYRSYFYGKRFKTISEWLVLAQDIEADAHRKYQPNKPHGSNHFIRDNKQNKRPETNWSSRPNNDKPPYPCRYCREIGSTIYHWHKDCPRRQQTDPTTDSNNTTESGRPNNTFIRDSCFTAESSIESAVMIPARIGSYKFRVFADTGSTVNVIPLHFARFLKLQVNRRNAKSITLANGSTALLAQSHSISR